MSGDGRDGVHEVTRHDENGTMMADQEQRGGGERAGLTCRRVVDAMLSGGIDGDEGMARHASGCASCRELAELVGTLAEGGRRARAGDLSEGSLNETRRRAAAEIGEHGVGSVWKRSVRPVAWSRVGALAAAALVLVAVGLLWGGRDDGRSGARPRLAGGAAIRRRAALSVRSAIDREIETARQRVDGGLIRFRTRYRDRNLADPCRAQVDRLRAGIETCRLELRADLRRVAGPDEGSESGSGVPGPAGRDDSEEGVDGEQTQQSDPGGAHDLCGNRVRRAWGRGRACPAAAPRVEAETSA